jgi:hypothetical protein
MSTTRTRSKEELYGEIKTQVLVGTPEPETDVNVKRGLEWAIGGTLTGAIVAIVWFVYRLFVPTEGANDSVGGVVEYIVGPMLGFLYGLIGAMVGGCIGLAVGIVFVAIAAVKESREAAKEKEEAEEEPLIPTTMRGIY